jgi:hypothetical protein
MRALSSFAGAALALGVLAGAGAAAQTVRDHRQQTPAVVRDHRQPVRALSPEQSWFLGQWVCRIGPESGPMSWSIPPVVCDGDCSGDPPAAPVGRFANQRVTYVSGDAAHFRFRWLDGRITRMNRVGENSMRDADNPVLECARYAARRGSVTGVLPRQ